MPEPLQLRRTPGWRKPAGAVVVARPSRWGNPFRVVRDGKSQWVEDDQGNRWSLVVCDTDYARARRQLQQWVVDLFALHIGPMGMYEYDTETLDVLYRDLRGRDLLCWCALDEPCHRSVLLRIANT